MFKYHGKAEQAAKRILDVFQNGDVPKALATVFIKRNDLSPCRSWSWSNQLLTALAGTDDIHDLASKIGNIDNNVLNTDFSQSFDMILNQSLATDFQ